MRMFCVGPRWHCRRRRVAAGGIWLFGQLESDFLPAQDEGAFVIDYFSRPGTSLTETDRMLMHVEQILRATPEVESFSRRTGARLALAIAEPNTGDFLGQAETGSLAQHGTSDRGTARQSQRGRTGVATLSSPACWAT